ncbi:MAG: AgmX/PglI C-terminal domain-containing protein [Polyangiaceae bacterium]
MGFLRACGRVSLAKVVCGAVVIAGCGKQKPAAEEKVADPVATAEPPPAATAVANAPATASVKAPETRGEVAIGRIASDVNVPDASLVIGSFKDDLSGCYEKELAGGSKIAGRLDLVFVVEPTGSLVGMPTVERSSMSPALGQCIAAKVSSARFPGFSGRRATLRAPVTFALKKP